MNHTPEPWTLSKPFRGDAGGKCVSITGVHSHYYESVDYNTEQEKADAERIVACVNACQGLSTESLLLVAQGKASITTSRLGFQAVTAWPITEPVTILSQAEIPGLRT